MISTNTTPDFPANLKPDEVVLEIATNESKQNRNIKLVHNGFLKVGPKSYKLAIMFEVVKGESQEFHHYVLDIYNIKKLNTGYFLGKEKKISLNNNENEIDALFKFLYLFYNDGAPKNKGTFFTLSEEDFSKLKPKQEENIPELVQSLLENPDSYKELLKIGGKNLLDLLTITAKEEKENITLILDFINSINGLSGKERIQVLEAIKQQNLSEKDLNLISGRIEGLNIFEKNLIREKTWIESDWQKFFEKNTWIFGYGLDYKFLKILQREAVLSNVTVAGKEAVTVDFLTGDDNFTVLVELKRPDTPLFKKNQNRSGSWKLSDELIDATSQILEQKAEWQIKGQTPQFNSKGEPIRQKTIDPKSILIIGNTSEFEGDTMQDKVKAETFELYRRNLRNIEIYTFDELYNRAKFIVSH